MSSKQQLVETEQQKIERHESHCLNCGAELNGPYCHMCGQEDIDPNPTVRGFISVYLDNAYMLDIKLFKTLWYLVAKPGLLAKDFLAGKIVSNMHPLKLNMFLLLAFITLFLICSDTDAINKPIDYMMHNEELAPDFHMEFLSGDVAYTQKMAESSRDSVQLFAPLALATRHPEYISCVETIEDNGDQAMSKWIAVIPHCLIEDGYLFADEDGYYHFSSDPITYSQDVELLQSVWQKIVDITTTYLPIIVLFTIPLLSLSVAIVQRKSKRPHIYHFVFALYYTAFIEFIILFTYILFLTVTPSTEFLEWFVLLSLFIHLTAALRRTYNAKSWIKAAIKALFVNIVYFFNCIVVSIFICIIACILVASLYV